MGYSNEELDQVGKLEPEDVDFLRSRQKCINPTDAKYGGKNKPLSDYLSPEAEWKTFAKVQCAMVEVQYEMGLCPEDVFNEVRDSLDEIDPLNIMLLEGKITKHDILAVIEEMGKHISHKAKTYLHPATTSYDIIDTARAYLFKGVWEDKIKPKALETTEQLYRLAKMSGAEEIVGVGRTHLKHTSPIPYEKRFSNYVSRLITAIEEADRCFGKLKGKISGMVGTGAGTKMVTGDDIDFERRVLEKFELDPDYTATQIVPRDALAYVANSLVIMSKIIQDFSEDVRLLYSSDMQEMVSRDSQARLGGSSADAGKDNPIRYENVSGSAVVVESGMRIVYDMIVSNLERDLRNSVEGRYEPQNMLSTVYRMFSTTSSALRHLDVNRDKVLENLEGVRKRPTEAMTAILKGERFDHPDHGYAHDFVKEMAKKARDEQRPLINVCKDDDYFLTTFKQLTETKQSILDGNIELYNGSPDRSEFNLRAVEEYYKKNGLELPEFE